MGVEVATPLHHAPRVSDLLPDWRDRGVLVPDAEMSTQVGCDPVLLPGSFGTNARPGTFLPSALSIYGLQHTTNNLNEDIHKALVHWPKFWEQLKNIEGLLLSRGRRRRFTISCVLPSPMAHVASRFDKWSVGLYEKRWKCVLAFLKRLCPLMNIFRVCWDEAAYSSADDRLGRGEGNARPDANGANADDDGGEFLGQFDAKAFTTTIKSAFFNRYLHLASAVDELPEKRLASWGESCECHEPLFKEVHISE